LSHQLFADRLLERAAVAKVVVPSEHIVKLQQYYDLLERWNLRLNLTALPLCGYPCAALDRLLLEPLAALPLLKEVTGDWVDLGSGGGSPAIPLKIGLPELRLLMTEARERKAAFLREVVRAMALHQTSVLSDRFQRQTDELSGSVALVTVRALKIDRALCDFVTRVLQPEGRLLIFGYRSTQLLNNLDLTHSGDLPGSTSRFGLLTKRRSDSP
jgi:16S rRNA (guanine527-N7)-methyltransferase